MSDGAGTLIPPEHAVMPRVLHVAGDGERAMELANVDVLLLHSWQLLHEAKENHLRNPVDYYRAVVCLRSGRAELASDGRQFFCGITRPGMFHVTGPDTTLSVCFRLQPPDGVHLLISREYLARLQGNMTGVLLHTDTVGYDIELNHLCSRLPGAAAQVATANSNQLYLSGLTAAILARLLHSGASASRASAVPRALAKWRMLRVQQYVEEHLAERISLRDLATACGMSRMYFAAQFRRTTGLGPHEFVLRERVRLAKRILSSTDLPLIQVAFETGFRTHSHFSSTFKRVTGVPPLHWRALQK